MISLPFLVLLALPRVYVTDSVYVIPPKDWGYIEVADLRQRAGRLEARYRVASGPPNARLALIRAEDREKLKAGQPHTVFAQTAEGPRGLLSFEAPQPDDYELVVFNQGSEPSSVHVTVSLEFPAPLSLSPQRRLTVVLISFAVFFGIVTWSTRRLLRAVRR